MADILTPVLGESVAEATVGRWTKKSGDTVKKDEVLVELETDKVALEVSSPADGVLTILVAEGETVTPGTVLGSVGGAGAAAAPSAPAAAPAPAPAPAAAAPAPAPAAAPASSDKPLSPAVNRIVSETGLDPNKV
ncbi:biotin/lipoyl-containing protein, partial [Asticcacaulis biprosthecium]|uniref:biotin/lipoyl-containing protein n=1 Tax=Asticcacaulis biprosthecium TaxID=76891 RepID=UPI00058D8456